MIVVFLIAIGLFIVSSGIVNLIMGTAKFLTPDPCSDIQVKIKKLHIDASIPTKANKFDAGYDLKAVSKEYVGSTDGKNFSYIEMGTGLSFEIPPNHVGLLFPRSSISNYSNVLTNAIGVIDSGYRGEVKFRFKTLGQNNEYKIGDKIGQLIIIPIPQIQLVEADELSDSDRNTGGFGSSGV